MIFLFILIIFSFTKEYTEQVSVNVPTDDVSKKMDEEKKKVVDEKKKISDASNEMKDKAKKTSDLAKSKLKDFLKDPKIALMAKKNALANFIQNQPYAKKLIQLNKFASESVNQIIQIGLLASGEKMIMSGIMGVCAGITKPLRTEDRKSVV